VIKLYYFHPKLIYKKNKKKKKEKRGKLTMAPTVITNWTTTQLMLQLYRFSIGPFLLASLLVFFSA
jgi:hypothetical protein